jgi:hypothetical protein
MVVCWPHLLISTCAELLLSGQTAEPLSFFWGLASSSPPSFAAEGDFDITADGDCDIASAAQDATGLTALATSSSTSRQQRRHTSRQGLAQPAAQQHVVSQEDIES